MKYHCQVPGYTYSCPDTGRECVGLEVEADSADEARAKALEEYGITGGIPLGKVICQPVGEEEPEGTLVASLPIEHTELVLPEDPDGRLLFVPKIVIDVEEKPAEAPERPVSLGSAPVDLKKEPAAETVTGSEYVVESSLWSIPASPDDPPAPVAMGPAEHP